MSKPFGNTSDVVMPFSRWLSVPILCQVGVHVVMTQSLVVFLFQERRLQPFTVIIFSLCSFRLVGLGISRMPSVPVISIVPVVC